MLMSGLRSPVCATPKDRNAEAHLEWQNIASIAPATVRSRIESERRVTVIKSSGELPEPSSQYSHIVTNAEQVDQHSARALGALGFGKL